MWGLSGLEPSHDGAFSILSNPNRRRDCRAVLAMTDGVGVQVAVYNGANLEVTLCQQS